MDIAPENLVDKWWRLNNLYWIIDKYGKKVLFKCNEAQKALFDKLWYMTLILKDRQRGMCLDPETRILTTDYRWVPISDIEVGREVIAVDEHPPGGRGRARKMRAAIVEGKRWVHREAYQILFDDGRSVICTDKHPWLSKKVATDAKWRCLNTGTHKNADKKNLEIGTKVRSITSPWGESTLEDYWFGGMLDGEGCMVKKKGGNISVCQSYGPVWERLEKYYKDNGYSYRIERDDKPRPSKLGNKPTPKLELSRMNEIFKLLGVTRPTRFLTNRFWEGKELPGKKTGIGWSKIVEITPLGPRMMVDLQTSTGTYIAEGFVSHNTTFICLYFLDDVLFIDNIEAGIVAHKETAAIKIFRRKIKFPYDNLPAELRDQRPLTTSRNDELRFPNNSTIYVSTSMRSDTINRLHLSEFGQVCAKFPDKAKEIISGSIEAMHKDSIAIIESTAEGSEGLFCEYCKDAQNIERDGRRPTRLEWKLFFLGWTGDPDKRLEEPVPLTSIDHEYFAKTERKLGITLDDQQKWWYAAKRKIQRESMKKENPATPEEAFEAAVEGAYYATEIADARDQGRIKHVPYVEGIPVDTWWDLGWDDSTSIWFTQTVGREIHVIDYYENQHEGLLHYGKVLKNKAVENEWIYGAHTGPHDTLKHELGPGKTLQQQAVELKDPVTDDSYAFYFVVANKINYQQEGIEAVRSILPFCWFDLENTTRLFKVGGREKEVGLPSLENYRKEYDEKKETYRNIPLHNWASHGAKAFETMAITHQFGDMDGYEDLRAAFG